MPGRAVMALGLGAVSGLISAVIVAFCHMGDVPAPEVFGYCLGMRVSSRCDGVDAALYLFPGPIFGIVLIGWERWWRLIDPARLVAFVAASGVGNAVAVFLCVWLTDRLGEALDIGFLDLPMAIAGAISGAVGGALLGGTAAMLFPGFRLGRSIMAATVLGLLVPLVVTWEVLGVFLFYPIWQAGYALALTTGLPDET